MEIRASELAEKFQGGELIQKWIGPDSTFERISPLEDCKEGDLVFIHKPEALEGVLGQGVRFIAVPMKMEPDLPNLTDLTVIFAANLNLLFARVRQAYGDCRPDPEEWGLIHPTAVIHPSAKIPEDTIVGPHVVVGKNCVLGSRVVLHPGCILEENVTIGNNVIIQPKAVIGWGSVLGNNVEVKAASVIGSEGYGFAQDSQGKSHRIPQTGHVVLEDDVTVGSHCCIDRATFQETRIKRGTKLDNFCHIAHNVTIGEDCLLTAGFVVAGSTKIGNRVIASGQTGILDHLEVADGTILLHRAGVTENITESGAYAGLPLQPLKEYMKNMAVFRKLSEMRKTIQRLEKAIGEKKITGENDEAS